TCSRRNRERTRAAGEVLPCNQIRRGLQGSATGPGDNDLSSLQGHRERSRIAWSDDTRRNGIDAPIVDGPVPARGARLEEAKLDALLVIGFGDAEEFDPLRFGAVIIDASFDI